MVICLERVADLHVAQLMPLPLTVSCSSKIQTGFTFLVPAHPGCPVPDKGPLDVSRSLSYLVESSMPLGRQLKKPDGRRPYDEELLQIY